MKEEDWIKFLEVDHKIKRSVWDKHKIRFDNKFLYIPYFDKNGQELFTKKRTTPEFNGANKYLYPVGSKTAIYPIFNLANKELVLTEGELDALTLESHGIAAVTTGSSTSFKTEFIESFKGKNIFVCFDNDDAGKTGAEKVANILSKAGIKTAIIEIPKTKGIKDIGDFFKAGNIKEDFLKIIRNAKVIQSNNSGTETPHSIPKEPLLTTDVTYFEIEEKVKLLLPNSQTALKLVLAVAVSCCYKNPLMLWLLLVGVPSSGKTDIVRLIRDADLTYYLDNLTQNAFISGERSTKSNKVHDLLPLIDQKCLVIKDWTSIFSLDEKMTKKLLGDLVGIYDKEFTKFSSRRGNVSYNSAFSQLGCITPATLNKHTNYMNMIGPRFLAYTMPPSSSDDTNTSYELIFSDKDRSEVEKEARKYTSSYLNQLSKQTINIKPLNKKIQKYLRVAAELMSNCRGIVILQSATFKNEDGEEVKYYEVLDIQIEEPWRAIQQLILLAQYLAFVVNKDEVGIEELTIIKEVVISSMPADRSQALRAIKNHGGRITAKELADLSDKSAKTSRRLLDELFALKVLEKNKGYGSIATDYEINSKFKDFLLLNPAEFMSTYSSGTETTQGIDIQKEEFLDKTEAFLEDNRKPTVEQGDIFK